MNRLNAVIMAGGSGTRFWPMSRRVRPKQLICLTGDRSLIQQTVDRLDGLIPVNQRWVITGADQRAAILEQLPDLKETQILGEPCPRDTAACVGLAALALVHQDPEAMMLLLPADHVIEPIELFQRSLRAGAELIECHAEALVTFGVRPTRPETGYGYIERGEPIGTIDGISAFEVARFREKPDRATAEDFLATGRFAWNAGIFLWKAQTILDALTRYQPELAAGLHEIATDWGSSAQQATLDRVFPTLAKMPIDKAVLELSQEVRVLEVLFDWNDVGDWRAMQSLLPLDEHGNAVQGPVLTQSTQNCIVVADGNQLIATLGLEDVVVVQSGGVTLVARKDELDQLKGLVQSLGEAGYDGEL